jgi:hypothetical protein
MAQTSEFPVLDIDQSLINAAVGEPRSLGVWQTLNAPATNYVPRVLASLDGVFAFAHGLHLHPTQVGGVEVKYASMARGWLAQLNDMQGNETLAFGTGLQSPYNIRSGPVALVTRSAPEGSPITWPIHYAVNSRFLLSECFAPDGFPEPTDQRSRTHFPWVQDERILVQSEDPFSRMRGQMRFEALRQLPMHPFTVTGLVKLDEMLRAVFQGIPPESTELLPVNPVKEYSNLG